MTSEIAQLDCIAELRELADYILACLDKGIIDGVEDPQNIERVKIAGDPAYLDRATEVGKALQLAYEKGSASEDAEEAKAVLALLGESRLTKVEDTVYLVPGEIGDAVIEQYRKMGLMP